MKANNIVKPDAALKRLIEGNKQYISSDRNKSNIGIERRKELALDGQHPYAIILACSDSRTPPEHIFNAGLGELFVIRNAGNLVGDYELGSVEYAAEHLGISLVLVLGHNNCGAVNAAVGGDQVTGALGSVISEISKSVDLAKSKGVSETELTKMTEDLNISNSVDRLMQSPVIMHLVKEEKLAVAGAKYVLETGEVVFF